MQWQMGPRQAPRIRSPDSANPLVGTGWRGHMFPGATAPFGLVQLSPDSSGPPEPHWNVQGDWYEWQHCSGYNFRDNVINGFSHTHVQGSGGINLGDLLIMPLVEGRNWSWNAGRIEPLTYMQIEALGTDSGIVSLRPNSAIAPSATSERSRGRATTASSSTHPTSTLSSQPQHVAECTAIVISTPQENRALSSISSTASTAASTPQSSSLSTAAGLPAVAPQTVRRMTVPFSSHWTCPNRRSRSTSVSTAPSRVRNRAIASRVKRSKSSSPASRLRIPSWFAWVSRPSVARAPRKIFERNFPAGRFDAVARNSSHTWNELLSGLKGEFFSRDIEKAFYSDAYHSSVAPTTYNDVDGAFRGQDLKPHSNPGFTKYTTLSIWDIYRGQFPFLTLTQPQRINDIVRTLLLDYEQLGQHALPMWPLWANETWSMIGFHAVAMILGAYVRGFRDFDIQAAYTAVRDTALVGAEARGIHELQAMFRQYGYVPSDLHGGSVSTTLDSRYDYWCASALARLLGKADDAEMFQKLSQSYQNVFNPATGFMQGKSKDGQWRTPFRPDQETDDYVETDAWQASFSVPHDVQGLIQLYGGDEAFIAKLDGLFTAPSKVLDARPDITGMVGQDAQGNEPSNHHPYLFSFAGAPWKTQYWTRKVASLYNATPAGIPGNDDCGQLASWFVFAASVFIRKRRQRCLRPRHPNELF